MVSSIVKSLSTLLDKIKRDGEKLNQTQIKQEVWKMIRKENPNVSEKDFDKLYDKAQELANDSRFQRKQRIDIPVEQRINIPIDDTKKMVSAAISGIDQKVLKDAMSQMSIPGRSVENFTSKYGLNKPANHEERQNNNKSNPPTHLSK